MKIDETAEKTLSETNEITHQPKRETGKHDLSRRSFLTRAGSVATVAATAGALTTLEPLLGGKASHP